ASSMHHRSSALVPTQAGMQAASPRCPVPASQGATQNRSSPQASGLSQGDGGTGPVPTMPDVPPSPLLAWSAASSSPLVDRPPAAPVQDTTMATSNTSERG